MKSLGMFQRIKKTPDGPVPRRADRMRTDVVVLRVFLTALACLTITTLCAGAGTPLTARNELVKTLAAMGKLKSIQSAFVCEKKLQILRKPFFSRGMMTIARPRHVRFETVWPYRSCYILNGQSIYMRNESDSHWRAGTVDSQPAIGIIMRQFAAWSLGNAEKVSAEYQISMKRAVRLMPHIPHAPDKAPVNVQQSHAVKLSLFTLRPRRGVLKQAIQEIQLGFALLANVDKPTDHARHYHLIFIRIVSKNGDQSLFSLRHTKVNLRLNPHSFTPVGPA